MSDDKNKKIKIISQCKMIKMTKKKQINKSMSNNKNKNKNNSKKNLKNTEPKPSKLLKLVNQVMTIWQPY